MKINSLAEDIWDPRWWPSDVPYRPITVSQCGSIFAVVDLIDYEWALQWAWGHKLNSRGKKVYPYRVSCRTSQGEERNRSIFLHIAILERFKKRPWRNDIIGDHRDGNTLNCRRSNLRWVDRRFNNLNINGSLKDEEPIF